MRILTVVGNRPQFIKAAAVSPLLRETGEEILVHTGQHFDEQLSKVFFTELGLPTPDHHLGIGGGSNTSQTARMLAALEPLVGLGPDAVLVYGDTNSTLAGALAGAQSGVPVAHVEAGMRSFDRSMPEELNRVLTDHASSLLLCSGEGAARNLRAERVAGEVAVVGDVMVDVALAVQPRARERPEALTRYGVEPERYLLLTAHRAGNVDDPVRLSRLVELILALEEPVVFPLHPRTERRLREAGLLERLRDAPRLRLISPLGYLELNVLLVHARAVLTDSGGLQKEAYLARVPCVTLRSSTEWTETVDCGWNVLVDLDGEATRRALARPLPAEHPALYGDGQAGRRVIDELRRRWGPGASAAGGTGSVQEPAAPREERS